MKRRSHKSDRLGALTVEFALVAPLLFLFVFAAMEFSRVNMLLHTTQIAAVEGARKGILPGATAQECQRAAQEELNVLGVSNATISVQPPRLSERDTDVTVVVTVPLAGNGYVFPKFFLGKSVAASVKLRRESPSFN